MAMIGASGLVCAQGMAGWQGVRTNCFFQNRDKCQLRQKLNVRNGQLTPSRESLPAARQVVTAALKANFGTHVHGTGMWGATWDTTGRGSLREMTCLAAGKDPNTDTRIFYDNDEDGWITGSSSSNATSTSAPSPTSMTVVLDGIEDTYYKFMGLSANASVDEIRSAHRKLSKLYHPDTTDLSREESVEKFQMLRKAYSTLMSDETRRIYDWQLTQSALKNLQGERRDEPTIRGPARVRPKNSTNVPLSGQASTALVFDVIAIFVSILTIIFVVVFKGG
eukprot:jgi/Mesvir1/28423/Mv15851-RA.1